MAWEKYHKYPKYCLLFYLIIWILLAIKPADRFIWLLENLLPVIFVLLLIFTYKKFRLSNISYTLITIFLILHAIGAHYTYSGVPFIKSLFGVLHFQRDNYDRLTHFAFGLFMAYPVREFILKHLNIKGVWGYYIPATVMMSSSAAYEIIEWVTAIIVSPKAAAAFLGMQNDIFDAQKDMLMAMAGAIITMSFLHFKNGTNKNQRAY